MDTHLNKIPFSEILAYVAVGLLLLIIFKFISKYIIPTISKHPNSTYKIWHRVQIISWLFYSAMFYAALLHKSRELTLIATILIVGLGWSYWRNLFFGIIIKFYGQFNRGDRISTDFVEGIIKTINLSQSELINDKGELIVVPNYKLRTSVLKQLYEKDSSNTYPFTVKVSQKKKREDVYNAVIECPYITANQDIFIEKKKEQEYLIRVSIIDSNFIEKINDYFCSINKKED
ncbi:MAG: mechanosensitive ion channel family protein [Flavobacteriales bacterium]|nr:mechanosensitive ion channel family protein [Flavobacteriales bacterium]